MWQGFFDQLAFSGAAFGTWSASDKDADVTLSNGNLTATIINTGGVRARPSQTTGKRYFEVLLVSRDDSVPVNAVTSYIGITSSAFDLTGVTSAGSAEAASYRANYAASGVASSGVNVISPLPRFESGDRIGVAVDIPNTRIWFSLNGTWVVGDPSAVTGYLGFTFSPAAVFPTVFNLTAGSPGTCVFTANFGRTAFTYSLPTGYTSWLA